MQTRSQTRANMIQTRSQTSKKWKKKEKRNKHMVFEYIIYVLFVCMQICFYFNKKKIYI